MWTFYDFLDGRGVNLIRHWLDGLPDKARAKINTRILFMRAMSVWPEQYVSALKGWPDLVELRVVSAGNQYRPLGFYLAAEAWVRNRVRSNRKRKIAEQSVGGRG